MRADVGEQCAEQGANQTSQFIIKGAKYLCSSLLALAFRREREGKGPETDLSKLSPEEIQELKDKGYKLSDFEVKSHDIGDFESLLKKHDISCHIAQDATEADKYMVTFMSRDKGKMRSAIDEHIERELGGDSNLLSFDEQVKKVEEQALEKSSELPDIARPERDLPDRVL